MEFSTKMWTEENLSNDKIILMLSSASDRQGSQQSQVFDGYIPVARKFFIFITVLVGVKYFSGYGSIF